MTHARGTAVSRCQRKALRKEGKDDADLFLLHLNKLMRNSMAAAAITSVYTEIVEEVVEATLAGPGLTMGRGPADTRPKSTREPVAQRCCPEVPLDGRWTIVGTIWTPERPAVMAPDGRDLHILSGDYRVRTRSGTWRCTQWLWLEWRGAREPSPRWTVTIFELFVQSGDVRLEVYPTGLSDGAAAYGRMAAAAAEGIGTVEAHESAHVHLTDLTLDDVRALLDGYDVVNVSRPRDPGRGMRTDTSEALALFEPDVSLEALFFEI